MLRWEFASVKWWPDVSSLFNTLSICAYDMRKPIQFIPGCMVNISYNVVVNTNTVNKQANTYAHTHARTHTRAQARTHTHAHTHAQKLFMVLNLNFTS